MPIDVVKAPRAQRHHCTATRGRAYAAILLGVVLCLVVWTAPTLAHAQVDPIDGPRRVVLAPTMPVFLLAEGVEAEGQDLSLSLRAGLSSYLVSSTERFEVVSHDALMERIGGSPLFEGTLSLARQWAELGLENYKRLQVPDAIENLERALQNYQKIGYESVDPREVSEILLYLALSYLEDRNDVVRPLDLMQKMVRLDPRRPLRPGYYPEYIVQFYRGARDSVLRELRNRGPSLAEARDLSELMEADLVVFGYAVPGQGSSTEVLVYVYTAAEDEFLPLETHEIEHVDAVEIKEAANRVMSRYAVCLFEPRPEPPRPVESSRGDGPFSIQLNFAYASFLQYPSPIEEFFGNYGLSIAVQFLLTREFGLSGGLQVLNSIRDYDGILRQDFSTIRGFLGGELGFRWYRLRLGVQTALEVSSVGPIEAFGDKNCLPAPDVICPNNPRTVIYDELGFLMGVNTRPRLTFRITPSFEAAASVSISYYFYPMTDRVLNFPLTGEFGVQYRF